MCEELLKRVADRDPSATAEVIQFDQENRNKGVGEFKGKFWQELQQHDDWPKLQARRYGRLPTCSNPVIRVINSFHPQSHA
eukprot:s3782_g1.t1